MQVDGDNMYYAFNHRYQGVKGTPYLLRTWQKADLRLQSDQVLKDVYIKYDLIENNLMAIRQPGDSIILASGWVKEFLLHELVVQPTPQIVDRQTSPIHARREPDRRGPSGEEQGAVGERAAVVELHAAGHRLRRCVTLRSDAGVRRGPSPRDAPARCAG